MNDDLVPFSRRVVSRQLMQTHEALNIRVVLVEHARETREKRAINTCEILGSELRLYIKVGVVNVHRQESRPSTWSRLQSTKEVMDATLKSHNRVKVLTAPDLCSPSLRAPKPCTEHCYT